MQVRKFVLIGALALFLAPASAQAQNWFVSPFIGGNFGGNADFGDFPDEDDEVEKRLDFGATIGWNPNVIGFEVDLAWSPNFFEDTAGDRNFEFGDNNVTTIMGNLLLSAKPGGGIRPYASGGLGLIRANVASATGLFNDLSTNDLGVNIGGGLNANFSDNVGIRGDLRYFRALQNAEEDNDFDDLSLGSFDFWRGTVGLTFRW
ncbi:MAG TPA: porin family protein [Vicinamibacterales bacterium]|nr:porin family protein [Vicinamibacterales bacterium]